jgi:hypothetical protein
VVSATTTPSTETLMRRGFAVIVIGWSGPGNFMILGLFFGQPDVIGRAGCRGVKAVGAEYSGARRDLEERTR